MEVLDSRGNPTVWAEVVLDDGTVATASVPSGASTGTHEAVELRDHDPRRYGGKGVLQAVENVNGLIAAELRGMEAAEQEAIDARLIALDGSPKKSRLGANAILAVSCAAARVAASSRRVPLWKHLAGARKPQMPVPMVNIFSGGHHAGCQIEMQDFLAMPQGYGSFADALAAVVAVHRAAREELDDRGLHVTGVADEGGWGPHFESNEQALDILAAAVKRVGGEVRIGIDVAATHFQAGPTAEEMCALMEAWIARYPLVSIEDPLPEDDWEGWKRLTSAVGSRVQLIGDDLFATNMKRLNRGIEEGAANAVLVKMNQIGTITETLSVVDRARESGYRAVISARSGETEDSFLSDLAVASGAGQIKVGSVRTSERLAKYNRLLQIERGLAG